MLSYAIKPGWGLNYVLREKFSLPNLATHVSEGSSVPKSVADYFTTMLDQSLDWKRAEAIRKQWDGPFCLKGIVAVEDARSEEHTSELQSLMRISYAVFCLKKK